MSHPATSTTFVDRFLASAEAYRVPVTLVFNKTDTYDAGERRLLDGLTALYTSIGYPCLSISALRGTGLAPLRHALEGRTTLFAGNSGVGKSTLLNALLPEAGARTADLSSAHDMGMHTTTFSEMYPLPSPAGRGGYIIDTPGIKGFGTFDIERTEVAHYFREIFRWSSQCRYGDCTHTHEPACAVRQAVEQHYISQSRYASYLGMLDDKDEDRYR